MFVEVEFSIPSDKFAKFKELADGLSKSVPETIELCMYEKLDELLDTVTNNRPDGETTRESILGADLTETFNQEVAGSDDS